MIRFVFFGHNGAAGRNVASGIRISEVENLDIIQSVVVGLAAPLGKIKLPRSSDYIPQQFYPVWVVAERLYHEEYPIA